MKIDATVYMFEKTSEEGIVPVGTRMLFLTDNPPEGWRSLGEVMEFVPPNDSEDEK